MQSVKLDHRSGTFERFARITQAVSGISVIIGVCLALVQIYNIEQSVRTSAKSTKLSGLAYINQIIDEDNEVQKRIRDFLDTDKYDNAKILQLIKDKGSVRSAYRSVEMEDLRAIGRHYERLGAMVKLDYVDFDLVYEIVPFPDDFWNATTGLREAAATNWDRDTGLRDFWSNFAYLKARYDEKRKRVSEHGH